MHHRTIAVLIALCVFAGCSKIIPTAPMENLEGTCVGMVKNSAGSPVSGASLMLVPEGYSPLATVAGSGIDSTVSDEYGRYAFDGNTPGAYNLIAKSKGLYAMRRPIRISADAQVVLDDEILTEPGSISGVVHLQTATDHRPAIILFLGTTLYVKPSDSTGVFFVPALAQGTYTLRLMTTDNTYAVVETTIIIASGVHTTLPCIELEKRFVPVVDSLAVNYDPLMMRVYLTWPAIDTAKVRNCAIYCNRPKNLTPVATVEKGVTACTLDIIASPMDTFQYQICAIDTKGTEGPPAMGKCFVKYSALANSKLISAVPITNKMPFAQGASGLCFDRHKNIFVTSRNKIIKLDSLGTVAGEFFLPVDSNDIRSPLDYFGVKQTCVDAAGNLFAMAYSSCSNGGTCSSTSIIKISNDLILVNELPFDNVQIYRQYSFAVSATGAFVLHYTYSDGGLGYTTQRRVYDPEFNLVRADSIPERLIIERSAASNDTTICLVHDITNNHSKILCFDAAFNEIACTASIDYNILSDKFTSSVHEQAYPPSGPIFLGSKYLFAMEFRGGADFPPILLFIDNYLQPVARLPISTDAPLFFDIYVDNKGSFYMLSDTEDNVILKYSMQPMLNQ